jgi:predicted phage terminase large subunit-like protein
LTSEQEELLLTTLSRRFSAEELRSLLDQPLFGPKGLRRQLAALDFDYFREAYFGHWMVDEKTLERIPPASFHHDLSREFEIVAYSKGGNKIAWAAPRGYAKSTNCDVMFVAWCLLYVFKHYVMVIMDSYDQAKLQLLSLKDELENNEAIEEDFGPQKGPTWQEDVIILQSGARVEAVGTGMKLRGRRFKKFRPDLVVCDDLENDENVQTPTQRKKNENWFWKAVDKVGNKNTDFFVIGTILHYDSLLKHLLAHPRYRTKTYKALIAEPLDSGLWQEWKALYIDLADPNRLATARAFYEAHKAEMDEGAAVLWPDKESIYDLMVERTDNPMAFASEKQNEPVDLENALFEESEMRLLYEIVESEYAVFGACDPSLGKHGKQGDYSSIIDLGRHRKSGQMVTLEADLARRKPDRIISDILDKAEARIKQGHRYVAFAVETNQFQEFFKDVLAKESQKRGIYLPIVEVQHTTDKGIRIQRLQPDIKNGYLAFRARLKDGLLWDQLKYYPMADHDDGPDGLEMAVGIAKGATVFTDYKSVGQPRETARQEW